MKTTASTASVVFLLMAWPGGVLGDVIVSLNNPGSMILHEVEVVPGGAFNVDVDIEPRHDMVSLRYKLAANVGDILTLTGVTLYEPWDATTTRTLGELRKLGVGKVSRSTMVNILRRNGFDPGPKRGEGNWLQFIEMHAKTLWACDFLTKRIWTKRGIVDYFILFAINIQSRRVCVLGERHLRHLVHEFVKHYHFERPHQSKGNAPLSGTDPPPSPKGDIICHERLGGLLKHYTRRAA